MQATESIFPYQSAFTFILWVVISSFTKKRKTTLKRLDCMTLPQYESCVYMDYNATTPIFPEVLEVMRHSMETCFGNPSSPHCYGRSSKMALDRGRKQVADLLNVSDTSSIIFTSCGTESDNRAIDIAIEYFLTKHQLHIDQSNPSTNILPNIITCVTEHPAILSYLKYLASKNIITMTAIPVNSYGVIDIETFQQSLTKHTCLVTIMHANNEVGTIQPLHLISDIIQQYNTVNNTHILFHTDAAQSVGKVSLHTEQLKLDMVTLVGHKFGASKGVAALYIHPKLRYMHHM